MNTQAEKLKDIVASRSNTKNTRFIAVTSGKGGVGKSTISANLANILARNGYKVALFDADIGLANLDVILNVRMSKNLLHVLKGECSLKDILIEVKPNLTLIPGESGDEILKFNNQFLYERFFEESSSLDELDFIIIDSPPALGSITVNALSASDSVIIPIQCEFYALEGLAQILNTVKIIKKTINPKLNIKGFLPTMYSSQNNLAKETVANLKQHFENKLFKTKDGAEDFVIVPRNVKLAESPSFGKPVILYDIKSPGSQAYQNLAYSILG